LKQSKDDIIKEYGVAPMVEAFTPRSLDDHSRTSTRFNLVWDQAWLYVIVADAAGQKYILIRGYEKALTGMWLTSKLNADIQQVSPRIFKEQYRGPISFDLDVETQTARIKSWPSKHNFQIELGVDQGHWWEENGALDLHFKSLGPAMRIIDPGNGAHEGLVYTSEMFELKGTLNGEAVSGLGGLDQAWLPPGVGWTQCMTYKYIQKIWIPWATRYDDGTVEYGVNSSGEGDWHWGFYVKDGQAYLSKENIMDIQWGDVGGAEIPVAVDVRYGDHRFQWLPDGRADIIKGNMNWVSGKMVNTAKTAAPVETFAWNEFRARGK
jgi:hypothetical protein